MARDYDMRSGKDKRLAVEHIIFPNPDLLIKNKPNQELGVYVKNYMSKGKPVDSVKF